jgi:hypothetical protein
MGLIQLPKNLLAYDNFSTAFDYGLIKAVKQGGKRDKFNLVGGTSKHTHVILLFKDSQVDLLCAILRFSIVL